MIPSVKECIALMEVYGMLDNIKAHSIIVEQVAGIIAQGIKEAGSSISLNKVTAGALMHDIGKTLCLDSPSDHAEKGKEICLNNNLAEIAEIVGEHIRLKSYDPEGEINEKEIIYYADKRVNHDKIVSLEKRMEYLFDRYARNEEALRQQIEENFRLCRRVEKKLFADLNFKPEDLERLVDQTDNTNSK